MAQSFVAGDYLVFQVESGFGLLRVLGVEAREGARVWHLLVYEDFYPDVETAEAALGSDDTLSVWKPHLALTEHAFEKTPAARLSNHPLTEIEMEDYRRWIETGGEIHDRSVTLMLGLR